MAKKKKVAASDPLERLTAEALAKAMRDRQAAKEQEEADRSKRVEDEKRSNREWAQQRAELFKEDRIAAEERAAREEAQTKALLMRPREGNPRGPRFDNASMPTDNASMPTDNASMPTDNASMPTDNASMPTDNAESACQDWRKIIRDRMVSEDYSYNALGIEAGVSAAGVMRFIKGDRGITLETARRLCTALDLVLVPREMVKVDTPHG